MPKVFDLLLIIIAALMALRLLSKRADRHPQR